jgi:hypothetical protein
MGMFEGYRRLAEKNKRDWQAFVDRFQSTGLPCPDSRDFDGCRPVTRAGWDVYRSLLEKEGRVTAAEDLKIRRGLEGIAIREREEEIRLRLRGGAKLPDPQWPATSPSIPGDVALTNGASDVVQWSAIKDLGLDQDEYYRPVLSRARLQMYDIARHRGDFKGFLETVRPTLKNATMGQKSTALPSNFREVEITIPLVALKDTGLPMRAIRYHPEYGLIQGYAEKYEYYDRGASSFPGGRGSRVRNHYAAVRLLMENVNFRRCKGLALKSVWRVTGAPEIVVGRQISNRTFEEAMSCSHRFSSAYEVEKYLSGELESRFISTTLPVFASRRDGNYFFRFFGRPLEAPPPGEEPA